MVGQRWESLGEKEANCCQSDRPAKSHIIPDHRSSNRNVQFKNGEYMKNHFIVGQKMSVLAICRQLLKRWISG